MSHILVPSNSSRVTGDSTSHILVPIFLLVCATCVMIGMNSSSHTHRQPSQILERNSKKRATTIANNHVCACIKTNKE